MNLLLQSCQKLINFLWKPQCFVWGCKHVYSCSYSQPVVTIGGIAVSHDRCDAMVTYQKTQLIARYDISTVSEEEKLVNNVNATFGDWLTPSWGFYRLNPLFRAQTFSPSRLACHLSPWRPHKCQVISTSLLQHLLWCERTFSLANLSAL